MPGVDSSSEEDRDCNEEDRHANMVIAITRAMMATADIIRSPEGAVSRGLFGRYRGPCVKAYVCVIFFIGRSPLLICRVQVALRARKTAIGIERSRRRQGVVPRR